MLLTLFQYSLYCGGLKPNMHSLQDMTSIE